MSWALDLGTTNSTLARWDPEAGQPRLVSLPALSRRAHGDDPLEAGALIPSVVEFLSHPSWLDRVGAWPPLERLVLLGRTSVIGRPALERNQALADPGFVPGFKTALGTDPLRPVGRRGRQAISARHAARAFLRELIAEAGRTTGSHVRELVITVPVDSYEGYRAQLTQIAHSIGIRRVGFLDEPLAAALGYGLGLSSERTVLVVDIGGGTMHAALVRLGMSGLQQGRAEVLAKHGRPCGGNAVDSWVLQHVCRKLGYTLEDPDDEEAIRLWRRLMLAEACRVKEAVFFQPSAEFLLTPPGSDRGAGPRTPGAQPYALTREDLVEVLRANGFTAALGASIDAALADGPAGPVPADAIDDVLAIGGSTLLPGVFPLLEERFGRHRVRAWHPFEAVALGAASFAADRYQQLDFIVHDYAFVTHDARSHQPQYTVVVPRGTRFPTAPDFWKAQLVPTCSLGAPETLFKLVVCEIGRGDGAARHFQWDAAGDLHRLGGRHDDGRLVVPLNESAPTLGRLDPPHSPTDRRPRLEVAFGVDQDRWLRAHVHDLLTQRTLMDRQPVVRLL